eukprot:jgi/Chrzof1/1350/Cz10g04030.t1
MVETRIQDDADTSSKDASDSFQMLDDRFTLNDVASSSSQVSQHPHPQQRPYLPSTASWVRSTIQATMIAMVVQMFPKSTDMARAQQAQELPKWFASRYITSSWLERRVRGVVHGTLVLMAARVAFHTTDAALRVIRRTDDAINYGIAGAVSTATLASLFFERRMKLHWIGLFSALGAYVSYQGFFGEQVLLHRQQDLEKKHMHTPEPALKSWYDSELYVRLLHMEREEQRKQAAAQERIQQLQQQHEETDDQQQTQQEEQSMDMPPLSDAEPAHQQQQEEHEGQQQQGGQERVQW